MEELRKELNAAYDLLAAVSVRGDAVEVMAAARQKLRNAYKMAENAEGKDG